MANRSHTFSLRGGEDLVSPALDIEEGKARYALNYEQNYDTGFARIHGYREVLDGVTVPGEGPVRGTFIYDGFVYAIRNKIGGAAAGLWKINPTTYRIGSKVAGDAEGLWGTNIVVSAGSIVEITSVFDSVNDPINQLLPDGYYEFVEYNFRATAGTTVTTEDSHDITGSPGKIYAVNGAAPMFEFDGTTVRYYDSTYTPDIPQHVEAQGNRLALGFRAGEIAFSVLGDPTDYNPVSGAGNIGVQDYLTGMVAGPDGVLYILCKDRSFLFYGMEGPLADATLKQHNKNVGAFPFTSHMIGGRTAFFDKWGLTTIEASDRFGDVITNSFSKDVEPIYRNKAPQCSAVLRKKSQYRIYFNETIDGEDFTRGLIATAMEGEYMGMTHLEYPFKIHCSNTGEINNEECTILGTFDGKLYQADAGYSFDGAAYTSSLALPFNYLRSPGYQKKIRKVTMNISCETDATIYGSADFSFGQRGQYKDTSSGSIDPTGVRWNEGVWNEFLWGTNVTSYVEMYLNGHGETVSMAVTNTSATEAPHTLKDITFIYEIQRIDR